MCTVVIITLIGLVFFRLGTSSEMLGVSEESGEESMSLVRINTDNYTDEFYDGERNGSNVLYLPKNLLEQEEVFFLYNTLSRFLNTDDEVSIEDEDLQFLFHGYYGVNTNLTVNFVILMSDNQAESMYDRIMTDFAIDESIINNNCNYTIFPGIALELTLKPGLMIPGFENITLQDYNRLQIFVSFMKFYKYIEITCEIFIILGGIFICASILRYKHLQTSSNVYVFNLAVSDILQFTVQIIKLVLTILEIEYSYAITKGIVDICWTVGILSAIGITIDRYLAICHPSLMYRISTCRRAVQINVTFWALSLIATLIEAVSKSTSEINLYFERYWLVMNFVLPMCIILPSYICIGRSILKSTKMRQFCRIDEQPLTKKSIKIAAVIALQYIFCWAPLPGYKILKKNTNPIKNEYLYSFLVLQLFIFGKLFNPMLYALVSRDFRKAFKDLVLLCFGCIRRQLCHGNSIKFRESNITLNEIEE